MQRFRGSVFGIVVLLIAQFLLGMAANLFVTVTRHHPGANASNFFGGSVQSVFWALTQSPAVLILHAILGILLFLNAIVILVRSFQLDSRFIRTAAILGFLGIIVAGFNGAAFLDYNHDINSYIMAIGFALAGVLLCPNSLCDPAASCPHIP